MPRIVISDPQNGEAYQIESEESQSESLFGLKVGDQFDGEKIGLSGYKLKITGGSDEEGFPMRSDVKGRGRVKALLNESVGYNPPREGERRRKTVRGGRVSEKIVQLNMKVIERGEESIEEILDIGTVGESEAPEEESEEKAPEEEIEEPEEEAPEEEEEIEEEPKEEVEEPEEEEPEEGAGEEVEKEPEDKEKAEEESEEDSNESSG